MQNVLFMQPYCSMIQPYKSQESMIQMIQSDTPQLNDVKVLRHANLWAKHIRIFEHLLFK
mgnify:CR=1 FL=1